MKRLCPICKSEFADPPEKKALPFCSERCKLVDLGRWLGEDYVIAEPTAQPGLTFDN